MKNLKKISIILLSSLLIISSCGGEKTVKNTAENITHELIDSISNELMDSITDNEIKVCTDVYPRQVSGNVKNMMANDTIEYFVARPKIAILDAKKWPVGSTIKIYFVGGNPLLVRKVKATAEQWLRYVNLKFEYVNNIEEAQVRVAFMIGQGSWSYIGQDALQIDTYQPTMNFGWLYPNTQQEEINRVVLHEFGHMLGAIHEHSHPENKIKWNKEVVYQYYSSSPNFWTKDEIDFNIFAKYDRNVTQYSKFDPTSIMMYAFPEEFTEDGFSTGWNTNLSSMDTVFMKGLYPKNQTSSLQKNKKQPKKS
jgi:serralysin